jgi:hypothetical protein
LIELLQVLVIFSIVMAIVFGLFIQIKKMIERREAYHSLLDRTGSTLRQIEHLIVNAQGWCGGDSLGITVLDRDENYRTIKWQIADSQLTVDGAPVLPGNVKTIRFHLQYRPRADSAGLLPENEWWDWLDSDRSGALEGGELKRTTMVGIELGIRSRNQTAQMKAVLSLPRPIVDTASMR